MDIKVEVCPVSLMGQQLLKLDLEKNITKLKSYDIGTMQLSKLDKSLDKTISSKEEEIKDGYDDSLFM